MNLDKFDVLARLLAAVQWGLDDARPAWRRTLGVLRADDRYASEDLNAAKAEARGEAPGAVECWYEAMQRSGKEPGATELKEQPEALWRDLYFFNDGIFAGGPDPLDGLILMIPSSKALDAPLVLGPQRDGWGVEPHAPHTV